MTSGPFTVPMTCRATIRPVGVTAITLDTSRRLLTRRMTGGRPAGAHVVLTRLRNV